MMARKQAVKDDDEDEDEEEEELFLLEANQESAKAQLS